jgi:DDE superfamily endonuclease
MEDVLDLYGAPYDPLRPQVCVDERPSVLHADKLEPLPMKAGQPARYDYEYERKGGCNLFMVFQPLTGWRQAIVTERRANADFAYLLRDLVDVHFPEALVIRVVLDNLSTHSFAALYATFPPEEARRIARKLEFHYTPKHGSWLNIVEIELGVLVKQCLNRRIPDMDTLQREVTAWQNSRNAQHATVQWLFNVTDARTRLSRFYP